MTIVVPYRSEVNDGIELRYALRSIEKYLSRWGYVVLIGKAPGWYKGLSFSEDDHAGRKEFSIYNKLLKACERETISSDFILWNDDHFLLQPLDVSEIKYWHNGRMEKELQSVINGEVRRASGRYRQAIEHTLEIAPLTLNWDIHTPIIFNKERFKKTFGEHREELCVKSFYCYNNADEVSDKTFFMEDLKIGFQIPYERLKEKIANRLFFSTDKAAIGPDLIRLWDELYPSPSKFEL